MKFLSWPKGILLLWAPFAPVKDARFLTGLHAYEGRFIHVSPGIGNLHGLRFNVRPEVSVLNLR